MTALGGRALLAFVCAVALVAVGAPAATSSPAASPASVAALESGVLQQLNAIRAQHGLLPLSENARLAAAAEQHSREMGVDGYFQHDSVDGTPFWARIAHWYPASGYGYWAVGENLLWSSPAVGAATALDLWMHSPEHRANILSPRWREIGIAAVHLAAAGGMFGQRPVTIITTDFGARR